MRHPARLRSADQTFLVGETIYLRGLEPGDAKRSSAWRSSPFPIPTKRAKEILEQVVPAQDERSVMTLIACRRHDDGPVGAMTAEREGARTATVWVHADPALGAAGAPVKAEILRLVVPWFSAERHCMVVWVELDGAEEPVTAAAEALGMRPAVLLREALWRDGERHDQVMYELLHPGWAARLGDPGPGIAGATAPVQTVRLPAPRHATGDATPPPNAVMVGERVFQRPIEAKDAKQIARWSRQETETFFDNGRPMRSPLPIAHSIRKQAKDDPPKDIEFVIALRQSGEMIGDNGLYGLDWVDRTAETGTYLYRPEHRSGGFGTEAKHLLLAYAFDRLGLHMVRSVVWGPNTRSATALRKQGYRDAGRTHWVSQQGGDFVDDVWFDLLAAEWRAARS